jgi:uncharacterized membrane protein
MIRWSVALGALILAACVVLVGVSLLPAWTEARARDTTAQLTLTWVLIGGTLLAGLLLAGFLISAGGSDEEPSHTVRR